MTDWWKRLCVGLDIAVGSVPAIGDLYDAFTVVSGYSLSGKLTPMERALVVGTLVSGINAVPGVSGGAAKLSLKTVLKENLELHHLLSQRYAKEFAKAGLNIEEYTMPLARDIHRLKPNGVHTNVEIDGKITNWNKEWGEFFKKYEKLPDGPPKEEVLQQLDKMKTQFNLD